MADPQPLSVLGQAAEDCLRLRRSLGKPARRRPDQHRPGPADDGGPRIRPPPVRHRSAHRDTAAGLLACRQRRPVPYLFSQPEVAALMTQAATTIPSPLKTAATAAPACTDSPGSRSSVTRQSKGQRPWTTQP